MRGYGTFLFALGLAVFALGCGNVEETAIERVEELLVNPPPVTTFVPVSPQPGDYFGYRVDIDDDLAVVSVEAQQPFPHVFNRTADGSWSTDCTLSTTARLAKVARVADPGGHATIVGVSNTYPTRLVIFRNNSYRCSGWVLEHNAVPPNDPHVSDFDIDPTGNIVAVVNGYQPSYVLKYVRQQNGSWIVTQTISGSSNSYYQSVAITPAQIVVADPTGGYVAACDASNCFSSSLILTGPAGTGTSLDVDGNTLVVGSPVKAPAVSRFSVLNWDGFRWSKSPDILNPGAAGYLFGSSVAIQGTRIVVGAPWGAAPYGRAYSYVLRGSSWVKQHEFVPPSSNDGFSFGSSVAVSGKSALVGDPVPRGYIPPSLPSSPGFVYEYSLDSKNVRHRGLRTMDLDGDRLTEVVPAAALVNPGPANGVCDIFGGGGGEFSMSPMQVVTDDLRDKDPYIFGLHFAWGRFDDRAFDQLIVGAPYRTVGGVQFAGGMSRYPGSATGVSNTLRAFYDPPVAGASDFFGAKVFAGDFDDDGYDDVAVGALGDTTYPGGSAQIYVGDAKGLKSANKILRPPNPVAGDAAGANLAAGDFNCDGYDDLAVAATGRAVNGLASAGVVYVYNGGPSGLSVTPSSTLTASLFGDAPQANDFFGFELEVGNFDYNFHNGIECIDLAIGVPYRDAGSTVDAGTAYIVYGSPSGLTVRPSKLTESSFGLPRIANAQFGAGLTAFKLGTDLFEHLAIGVPGAQSAAGEIHLMKGTSLGLAFPTPLITWTENSFSGSLHQAPGDRLGAAMTSGGTSTIVVGAPGKDTNSVVDAGGIVILYLADSTNFQLTMINFYAQDSFVSAPPPFNQLVAGTQLGYAFAPARPGR